MTPEIVPQIDPMKWAEAIAKIGWPVPVLVAWYVFWKYNPWRKAPKE